MSEAIASASAALFPDFWPLRVDLARLAIFAIVYLWTFR
jgi:hypothetical protein